MSTADSQFLVASSISMIIARIVFVMVSLLAIIIAWDKNNSIFKVVSLHGQHFLISKSGGIFQIYELLSALIMGLIADVLISFVTKEHDKIIIKEYEDYIEELNIKDK
ncbi:hypothetical protein BCR32DRAFT_277794 [Anaeromyces robustus]|uniref:Uncharacterized protein n=1 Tax=Anaeromyces robustus TaxID=1754192 RepID=A0A1Y1XDB8_9FUNG|nr:hypothetical protein BCR32DRAFT_277794 [Anaeromyces robustus]|eukprot:ORX83715.1 hypothetical protein BCR32DRAFT_277794 [Anaeromyces robustus]